MSDQATSKAGTITSGEDRFMEWKTKDGSYEETAYAQFDTFFEGIFERERFLDIMRTIVKKLLKKYKYPPEGMEDAVQVVIAQCEQWADNSVA